MEPGQSEPIPDKTEATMIGGSIFIKIPPEHADHINLNKLKNDDGPDEILLYYFNEEGPHGNYYSFWNPQQQETDNK